MVTSPIADRHPMPRRRGPITVPVRTAPGGEANGTEHSSTPASDEPALWQPTGLVAGLGFIGSAMFAIALSPFGLGQLAFVVVAPWAWLTLDARRISWLGYLVLFLCGFAMWTSLTLVETNVQFDTLLAHLPQIGYLGAYLPAFVLIGRTGRRNIPLPVYISLPFIWCGLEAIRCNFLGGIGIGLIAHAAADTQRILQLTDIAGSCGLGMLMVATGASVAELVWVTRRIRRLERCLPAQNKVVSDASSGPGTFRHEAGSDASEKRPLNSTARSSLERAVRRTRDRAREVHLASITASVFVMVGILVFANYYGRQRNRETRNWKLFESNQFAMFVVGGPEGERDFAAQASLRSSELLVASLAGRPTIRKNLRPTLIVAPQTEQAGLAWKAKLIRSPTLTHESELRSPRGANLWRQHAPYCVFPADRLYVPLHLLVSVDRGVNVEQVVNQSLGGLPDDGKAVDAAVVSIEPNWVDGSTWPRLFARSVAAAATANRCPVIAMVPERVVAVAAGDGTLHWLGSETTRESPIAGPNNPREDAREPISVRAMIDPRVSYFVSSVGQKLTVTCIAVTIMIPLIWLSSRVRKRI